MSDFMQGNKDDATAVPFSDDDTEQPDVLLDDSDKPDATPEERISRKQKRTERVKRLLDEGKQSKEENAQLKTELGSLKSEVDQLKGFMAAQRQQANAQAPGPDPYKRRLDQVSARQRSEWAAYQAELKAGTLTPERVKHYEDVSAEIEEAKISIHTERAIAARDAREIPARRQEQAQQIWVQKYPEVYQNAEAFEAAQALFQYRTKVLREKPTNELNDEIFTETMTRFKLGKKAAPSQSERNRFSGVGSSGGGGGSGSSGGIVMTEDMKRMAEAAYSDLPQGEAHKKWAARTGKRLREKKIA